MIQGSFQSPALQPDQELISVEEVWQPSRSGRIETLGSHGGLTTDKSGAVLWRGVPRPGQRKAFA